MTSAIADLAFQVSFALLEVCVAPPFSPSARGGQSLLICQPIGSLHTLSNIQKRHLTPLYQCLTLHSPDRTQRLNAVLRLSLITSSRPLHFPGRYIPLTHRKRMGVSRLSTVLQGLAAQRGTWTALGGSIQYR